MNLNRRPSSNDHDERGFSLMELLLVIVILGILAVMAAFAVPGRNSNSDAAKCKKEARAVRAAVEGYQARNGKLPTSVNDLVPDYMTSPSENLYVLPTGFTPRIQWNTSGPLKCIPGVAGLPQNP